MQIKANPLRHGVALSDKKAATKDLPIQAIPAPDTVAICMSQHIGKPAQPVVQAGDAVLKGQLIARADGPVSANIYSSVSGTVKSVETRKDDRGASAQYVVVQNDKQDNAAFLPPLAEKTKEHILERIREAGIVGLGGAAFPTYVKMTPRTPVDALVINGAECEPYLTCDYRLMVEKYAELLQGIRYLALALGVDKIYIGIEENKPDCIERFAGEEDIVTVPLHERYPMGSEKHLIYSCTGRKVPCGKLPADAGCVVQNVATAYAVYEAVELGKPLFERVLTVSGGAVQQPQNLLVPNGTAFSYILDYCGVDDSCAMIVDGGPMMGVAVADRNVVTKKATSGLLALTKAETDGSAPTPCVSCGRCARACPMHLMPMDIDFYTQNEDYEGARDWGGVLNCIECGSCAYVCPAKRPIVQSVRLAKAKLRELAATNGK